MLSNAYLSPSHSFCEYQRKLIYKYAIDINSPLYAKFRQYFLTKTLLLPSEAIDYDNIFTRYAPLHLLAVSTLG